jgi:hypothetical protein
VLQQLRKAVDDLVLETHPHYRTAIGVLGIALPVIAVSTSLLGSQKLESSISSYYHTSARDVFVGILWVIGVFLFFYRYTPQHRDRARSRWQSVHSGAADSWLGKTAGLCAVLVALLPTTPPPASKAQPPEIGTIHGVAAGILFTCLALFPLLLFSQSRDRGQTYKGYGWAMIGLLLLVVAFAFAPDNVRVAIAPWRPVLVLETLLIIVFGVSWFEKGRELASNRRDERSAASPAG